MSYYNFNVEYLNWRWRYRFDSRDPNVGQITSNDIHYKIIEYYRQICVFFSISRPIGGAVPNCGHGPSNHGIDEA